MVTTSAVSVSGLVKSFGRTRALDGLDLSVETGEVHGFLGPNGAGKTTTLRILMGLIRANAGTASVLGSDPWRDAIELHHRVAYVPGDVTLWPNLSGGEVIDLLGRLRGGLNEKRRAELTDRFDLDPTKKGRSYSTGNKQKVGVIAALASEAELLILDEPTAGLDPLMEELFRQTIVEERERGRTVLLSSHILSEVDALCERVTIIRSGKVVETGSLEEMRHLTRTSIRAEVDAVPDGLSALPGVHDLELHDLEGHGSEGHGSEGHGSEGHGSEGHGSEGHGSEGRGTLVRCEVDTAQLGKVLSHLTEAGVRSLVSQPATLEQLFLRHYRDELAEANGGANAGTNAGTNGGRS